MRSRCVFFLAVLCVLFCPFFESYAQGVVDWSSYRNGRFGYGIDIPPGFSTVAESFNGDGGVSRSADERAELAVWGSYPTEGDFPNEIRWHIDQDVSDGWKVTYQKQDAAWASWSGTKGSRIVYQRAIPACDGSVAYFRLEYDSGAKEAFDPVILRLVKTLRSGTCMDGNGLATDFPASLYGVWESQLGYCNVGEDLKSQGQRLEITPDKAGGSSALLSRIDHQNSDGSGFCEVQSVVSEGIEIRAPSVCGSYHHSLRLDATLHISVSPSGDVMSLRRSAPGEGLTEVYHKCR